MAASPKRTRRKVPRTSAPNCRSKFGKLVFIFKVSPENRGRFLAIFLPGYAFFYLGMNFSTWV
jgi:hypothetical protein